MLTKLYDFMCDKKSEYQFRNTHVLLLKIMAVKLANALEDTKTDVQARMFESL